MCWLYSVTNLLVIQHLKTLYLGGNHVRVVCERVWRNVQDCAVKQRLAAWSRGKLAACNRQKLHIRRACKGAEQSCQLENYRTKIQTGHSASSRLELATQSSREVKSPASPVLEKLTLRIPFSHQYKYPSFPQNMSGYSERKNPKRGFFKTPTQLERATHS